MGIFRRRSGSPDDRGGLPPNIVALMERLGRFELDQQGRQDDPATIWSKTQAPLLPFASSDPGAFVDALATAAVPVGGLASYGAAHAVWNLVAAEHRKGGSYDAIMSSAVEFLRANGVPPMRVNGFLWNQWLANGGTIDTWLPRIPAPSPAEAPISDFQQGEVRRVAQLTAEPDSNLILVRRMESGGYCAVIDARYSDEDPRRVENHWKSAETLHDLYVAIGLALQVPPYWSDEELSAYYPLPPPMI